MLEKISGFLGRLSDVLMPWMLGLLGTVLLADSGVYLLAGEGLLNF